VGRCECDVGDLLAQLRGVVFRATVLWGVIRRGTHTANHPRQRQTQCYGGRRLQMHGLNSEMTGLQGGIRQKDPLALLPAKEAKVSAGNRAAPAGDGAVNLVPRPRLHKESRRAKRPAPRELPVVAVCAVRGLKWQTK